MTDVPWPMTHKMTPDLAELISLTWNVEKAAAKERISTPSQIDIAEVGLKVEKMVIDAGISLGRPKDWPDDDFLYKGDVTELVGWHLLGRQSFFISDALYDALSQTDLRKIPVSCINPPYLRFWLQFETPKLIADEHSCGGFISTLFLDREQVDAKPGEGARLVERGEKPVSRSISCLFMYPNDRHSAFRCAIPLPFGETLLSEVDDAMVLHGTTVHVMENIKKIVCGLFLYLSSPHPDMRQVQPPGLRRARSPKGREIVQKKRKRFGNVFKVGFNKTYIKEAGEAQCASCDSGRHQRLHLRRGHWRNQACGKGRKDHRIIWIQPHWAGRAKGYVERVSYVAEPAS